MKSILNKNNRVIPLSVPSISGNEWKYIKDCLDTEWVSSVGAYVNRFESVLSELVGSGHAVACTSGTAALHVSLKLAGITGEDEVIVPTVTFIAPVNAVRYVGAELVFMDCDQYFNLDTEKTLEFIKRETVFQKGFTWNKTTGKKIAALIPVHVFGNAADLEPLLQICSERNIKIIEDAAESIGTYYTQGNIKNKYTGSVGSFGCYSFNGNKIVTTGGGGMIVTNDEDLANKARYLTTQAKDDPLRYVHDHVGYNYRLTNIQAALGVAQLERLPSFIETKEKNYSLYREHILDIPGLTLTEKPDYARNNHWMYPVLINKKEYGMDREELMRYLADKGIQTRPLWKLNHTQKPYADNQSYKIERAYDLLERTLNIPCSVNLTEEELNFVVIALKEGALERSG